MSEEKDTKPQNTEEKSQKQDRGNNSRPPLGGPDPRKNKMN